VGNSKITVVRGFVRFRNVCSPAKIDFGFEKRKRNRRGMGIKTQVNLEKVVEIWNRN
jgi:hypothetical protein